MIRTRTPKVHNVCDPVQRDRLEMQGYVGFNDDELASFGMWTRLAPAVYSTTGAIGTILGSAEVLWILAAVTSFGLFLRYQVVDVLYNRIIRHMTRTPAIPPHGAPRRFSSAVATSWLIGTAWTFAAGSETIGIVAGIMFVGTSSIPAWSGLCVPSWVYRMGGFIRRYTVQKRLD